MTAADFKSVVAAEKSPGGFDSHPLPFSDQHGREATQKPQFDRIGLRFFDWDAIGEAKRTGSGRLCPSSIISRIDRLEGFTANE